MVLNLFLGGEEFSSDILALIFERKQKVEQ